MNLLLSIGWAAIVCVVAYFPILLIMRKFAGHKFSESQLRYRSGIVVAALFCAFTAMTLLEGVI